MYYRLKEPWTWRAAKVISVSIREPAISISTSVKRQSVRRLIRRLKMAETVLKRRQPCVLSDQYIAQ